ncbi:unnamed protein product [Moneuplotes crassus]|uniref:Uncharacterized protein n=1 Tax=Euplotes crassus TaxID=5936 RepID=A0AAD1XUJ3_EUPCR|nr:unnamed protein product [Moneuplotes crassus]
MNLTKISIFILLLTLLSSGFATKTVNLVTSGTQTLNLIYQEPQSGEELRVQVQTNLDSVLGNDKVSTAICVNTGSSTYTVSDGTTVDAFAFMFSCAVSGGCTDSQGVGVTFFGSTAQYSSSNWNWKVNTRVDISPVNVGTEAGDGTTITSTFRLPSNYASWSKVPSQDETVYLKCFGVFNVATGSGTINSDQTVTSWGTQSTTVTVTASDLDGSSDGSSDGTSGAIGQFSLISWASLMATLVVSTLLF